MIALLLFNETARMSRPFHCQDDLRLSVCRWLVTPRADVQETLEQVYRQANADDRPNGKHERSASVGDVIILGDEAYTVGQSGFERIALSIERA